MFMRVIFSYKHINFGFGIYVLFRHVCLSIEKGPKIFSDLWVDNGSWKFGLLF